MKILGKILITALSLLAVSELLSGVTVESFYIAIIVALILGVINLVVKPVILLFTLPINILTLGLFTFIINGLLFWFVATFVDGFSVDGFWTAVIGALIVSFFKWLVDHISDDSR
ncbi:MAG: hypothetical protein COU27_03085 [Candidatus Levybacteria bacterium CG10_big_fil_rev_8_21_14_0_10_36_7]|nr:MAG: hypothetical protein COU27_03085 [Candidatus Levybacteria bacterium CG10_big_fil_rev_8_21_14_0_10_36_7]